MTRLRALLHSDRLILVIGLAVIFTANFASGRASDRTRCELGGATTFDNAQAWTQAYIARHSAWAADHPGGDGEDELQRDALSGNVDARAAVQYLHTVRNLMGRTARTADERATLCEMRLPLWPWQ